MASAKAGSRIFILALVTFVGWSLAHAQSLKIGLKGGALYLVSTENPYGASDVFTKPVSEGGYGFGAWVPSLGMEIRFAPPRGRISLTADVVYAPLHGSGSSNWLTESGDPLGGRDYTSKLYIVSIGPQWDLVSGPVRPYLGGRVLWTSMTDVKATAWSGEPFPTQIYGFNRFGLGLLGGTNIIFTSLLTLDVHARYNFTSIGNAGGYDTYFNNLSVGLGLLLEVL